MGFRVQGLKLIGAPGVWSEVESLGFGNEGRSFGFELGGRTVQNQESCSLNSLEEVI